MNTQDIFCGKEELQNVAGWLNMSKRTKREKRPVAKIDFMPYGTAIKAERMKLKESRNKVGSEMFLSPRYIANIENKGQHPSLQVFLEMVSRYHISVDQILYGEEATGKSTERMISAY